MSVGSILANATPPAGMATFDCASPFVSRNRHDAPNISAQWTITSALAGFSIPSPMRVTDGFTKAVSFIPAAPDAAARRTGPRKPHDPSFARPGRAASPYIAATRDVPAHAIEPPRA